jgi:adenylate cyclase
MTADADLDHLFARRVVEAEHTRATFVAVGCLLMVLTSLPIAFSPPREVVEQFGGRPPSLEMPTLFTMGLVGSLFVRARAGRLRVSGGRLHPAEAAAISMGEIALVGLLMVVGMVYLPEPQQALEGPVPYLLPVVIVLSALRMQPLVCLGAGVAGAATVVGGAIAATLMNPPLEATALGMPSSHLMTAVFLAATGVATALVTRFLRDNARDAVDHAEQRNTIRRVFGRHVSPQVVDRLLSQRDGPETELRDVCMMFLDIRGFTTLSESMHPQAVVDLLNQFFELTIDIVNEHGGIVNKFLGDGFMAAFGAPLSDGRDAQNAVEAAQAILAAVDAAQASDQMTQLSIGIGLHAGRAIVGSVGSPSRKEYTLIGDTVNLASRIEGLNKRFGSRLLLSMEVWGRLGKPTEGIILHSNVEIRGRREGVDVVQLA